MDINVTKNNDALVLALVGRLDTTTAPEFEKALDENIDGVTGLTIDLAGTEYISSAGLRVLLKAQKAMNAQGGMVVSNVCPEIKEVFDITGFSEILTIV